MKNLKCLAFWGVVFFAYIGHAQSIVERGGEGHGGDAVVTSDNAIRLRDLVDPGNCTWKSGKSILMQKEISSILDKLAEANPHFSYKLREQILKIKWCYTATLKKVETNDDEETLTYYLDPYAQNRIQAGIRAVNNVYIDRSILASNLVDGKMTEVDRPYFYIHEAMHAFLYMKTPNRNKRVRDAVQAIKDFYVGDTNADDLDAMVSGSNLLTLKIDSPMQNLIKIFIDPSLVADQRIKLASPVLSSHLRNDLLVQQWEEVLSVFSDDELTILTEKTGLTRFEFVKRSRGDLYLDPTEKPRFLSNRSDFSYELTNTDFGKCTSKTHDLENNNGPRNPGRNSFGPTAYWKDDFGFFWIEVFDKQNGDTLFKSSRQTNVGCYSNCKRYSGGYYTDDNVAYVYNANAGKKEIMQKFFYESVCDFKPML